MAIGESSRIKHEPPLVVLPLDFGVGHGDVQSYLRSLPGHPAHGWARDLKRVGTKLLATFQDVPKLVKRLFDRGALKKVSAEIYDDFVVNGKHHGPALKRVAALGADVPKVKTLQQAEEWFEGEKGYTVEMEVFDAGDYGEKGDFSAIPVLDKIVENFHALGRFSDEESAGVLAFFASDAPTRILEQFADDSQRKMWETLTGDVKHKVTACMAKMEGNVADAGAFCASMADKFEPGWRSKPKEHSEDSGDTPDAERERQTFIAAVESLAATSGMDIRAARAKALAALAVGGTTTHMQEGTMTRSELLMSLKAKGVAVEKLTDAVTDDALAAMDAAIAAPTPQPCGVTPELKAFAEGLESRAKELDGKIAKAQAMTKALDDSAKLHAQEVEAEKTGRIQSFLDDQVKVGRIWPAQVQGLKELLAAQSTEVVEFSDGDMKVKASPLMRQMAEISKWPITFHAGDKVVDGKGIPTDATEAALRQDYRANKTQLSPFSEDEYVKFGRDTMAKMGITLEHYLLTKKAE